MFSFNCGRKRTVIKRVASGEPESKPPISAVLV
jgi:hypothetical protein